MRRWLGGYLAVTADTERIHVSILSLVHVGLNKWGELVHADK
jgi:hypothetical protein